MSVNAPYIIARIVGPFALISGAALFAQTGRMMSVIDSLLMNDGLMTIAGFLSLLTGFGILAFAHSWRGLTEIIVTLLGWFSVARGLLIVFLPGLVHASGAWAINNPVSLPIMGGILALIGLWLCFAGFFTTHVPENEQLIDTLR